MYTFSFLEVEYSRETLTWRKFSLQWQNIFSWQFCQIYEFLTHGTVAWHSSLTLWGQNGLSARFGAGQNDQPDDHWSLYRPTASCKRLKRKLNRVLNYPKLSSFCSEDGSLFFFTFRWWPRSAEQKKMRGEGHWGETFDHPGHSEVRGHRPSHAKSPRKLH